jgi:hemolysin activation/secretion protein
MPVYGPVGVAVGGLGQWSDDSLPFAQTCGFASNEYSRAFDRSYVTGDSCFGGRAELFTNLPTEWADGYLKAVQVFAASDAGHIWIAGNNARPGWQDGWASAYTGLRVLGEDFIGEASLSKILDEPAGVVPQDETRFWVLMGLRF